MKYLFVCTGNTCRSPMAEAYFNSISKADTARSAGISAISGSAAAENAIEVMDEIGISLQEFRSQPVTAELIAGADRIICMTPSHKNILAEYFPEASGKMSVLGAGIPDPYGGSVYEYRNARDRIIEYTEALINDKKA